MQSGTAKEHLIHKVVFSQPAHRILRTFLFYNTVTFDTADGMFHPHPKRGDVAVQLFLLFGHLPGSGLFLWLTDTHPLRMVALIAAVLPQDTALRDAVVVVSNSLVMGAARHGGADKQNEAKHGSDHRIFDSMLFLLT